MPFRAEKTPCPGCGALADTFGDHDVETCPSGARFGDVSRNERHNDVRDVTHNKVVAPAQLPSATEVPSVLPDNGG